MRPDKISLEAKKDLLICAFGVQYMRTVKNILSINVTTAVAQADLKTLIHLIQSNWKFDVSSQANSDLNLKKWNKITVVPLARDLKLLKNHLCEEAQSAVTKLAESENSNINAYITLAETIYCCIILLNRRRPGELQRLLLSTYQECYNNSNVYKEFDRAISDAEKLLVRSFKRIVIRGKRGRGVPVLLTDTVQNDIDLLISVRRKYVSDKNLFLFAKPGSENTLCGYKVLEKYAIASRAKNPKAITTTRLRKHLATLTQMFNMKETDIEQLANFMGHTQAVHRQNYRLPDDVYQTAKLSKLLLLMESGNADCYKGKSLDDIDLDLEQDLLQDVDEGNDENDDIVEYEAIIPTEDPNEMTVIDDAHASTSNTSQFCDITNATDNKIKNKQNLVPWTSEQKNIVTKFF
ncbi:hypothetical protein ACJJTC_016055 [Scirpophaga incertulas]